MSWWSNEVKNTNTKLYIGQGIYKDEVAKEIELQIKTNRSNSEVQGSMYFSYRDIQNNRQGIVSKLKEIYSTSASTPTPKPTLNDGVIYQTHIENIGWQDWKSNGEVSGTQGKSKQLEAIQIELENAEGYSIEYRTHVENIGWQDWKSNGEVSGTEGQSKQLEAIQIRLIRN